MEDQKTMADVAEKALTLLDNLAKKLGTTSDNIFATLITQAKINAIINGVISTVMIVSAIIWSIVVCTHMHTPTFEENLGYWFLGGSAIYWIVTIIVTISNMRSIITAIYNPQYEAYAEIRLLIALSK